MAGKKKPKQEAAAPSTIGERIRAVRIAKGMTHEALARAAGIGLDTVQKIQSSQREPQASTLAAIAVALGVSADELLGLK
jgi:transcriptional regulator with XRE-family HTH domain